jgi:hypothetical protein
MDLTSRAHVSARGERGCESCERRNSEEKAYSKNAPMVLRPTGLGERWQPAGPRESARGGLGQIPGEDSKRN